MADLRQQAAVLKRSLSPKKGVRSVPVGDAELHVFTEDAVRAATTVTPVDDERATMPVTPVDDVRAELQVSPEDDVRAELQMTPEEGVRADHRVTPDDDVRDESALELEPLELEEIPQPAPLSHEAQVKQLLAQALTMAKQLGLVSDEGGGAFVLTETSHHARQDSSCTCAECAPYNQVHWYCLMCGSGPHDWVSERPRHERLLLDPGGVTGSRHACCTDQCVRDYLARITRPPARVVGKQLLDPTLALP